MTPNEIRERSETVSHLVNEIGREEEQLKELKAGEMRARMATTACENRLRDLKGTLSRIVDTIVSEKGKTRSHRSNGVINHGLTINEE